MQAQAELLLTCPSQVQAQSLTDELLLGGLASRVELIETRAEAELRQAPRLIVSLASENIDALVVKMKELGVKVERLPIAAAA